MHDQREDQADPHRQSHRVLVRPAGDVHQGRDQGDEGHVPEVDGERAPIEIVTIRPKTGLRSTQAAPAGAKPSTTRMKAADQSALPSGMSLRS